MTPSALINFRLPYLSDTSAHQMDFWVSPNLSCGVRYKLTIDPLWKLEISTVVREDDML